MSGTKWTDEQLAAIDTRGCNLLVSAAAGAGKTAVLVERIIKHIIDLRNPVDIDRLLVVTFTKAAAAEMRERIGLAITRELNNHPDSEHLNKQLMLLNRASITTLHSFCLDIIKKYFYRVDLDPAFRVADDSEALLLQIETLENLFEEHYANGDEEFLSLVEAYGGDRDDMRLQEMVLRLYNFAISNPWPEQWLQNLEKNYILDSEQPIDELQGLDRLLSWLKMQLQGCYVKIERAIALASRPDGPAPYITNLKEDLVLINDLIQAADHSWDNLYENLVSVKFGKLKACRDKDIDDLTKDRVKKIRDDVKKLVGKLQNEFVCRSGSEYREDLKKAAPYVRTIGKLVIEFRNRFRQVKMSRALVDFADLEHFCLQILLDSDSTPDNPFPSEEAQEMREHFAEVLVDEYQDINAVQETILKLISRQESQKDQRPNMFMVGDVKQSIYRFRLADPSLFMSKYSTYPRETGGECQAVDLTKNFRSRREVLNAVNFIFRQLMTPEVGEMPYDEKAELVCGANYIEDEKGVTPVGGPVELHLLEKTVSDESIEEQVAEDSDDDPLELDAAQREARIVARRIKEMVFGTEESPGSQLYIFDKITQGYRPLQFKDIVILMRATRGTANIYMDELKSAGIPVYADLGTGYFAAVEIETMMSLLKVIDNPRQDIPLAAVLRSPIVDLNAEELALIRLDAPEFHSSYYDAVKASLEGENLNEITNNKLTGFLEQLEKWRTMARQGSLAELIWRLYNETGYYAYVGGMPGGTQRQANLRALYDRARQYEATTYRGLFRFLRFIERFQDIGNDLGTARALSENEDVVRVMSIHKSKGLEFPVVIVTGLGKQFNNNDIRQDILLHKEMGMGLPIVEPDIRLTYPSLVQTIVKKRLQMELLAEEMRILYVALTRAKEKLILVGSIKDVGKNVERWCENVTQPGWQLPEPDLANAKNFLDWIGPAIARHKEGEALRQLAQTTEFPMGQPADDPVKWSISLWQPEDCIISSVEEVKDTGELLEKVRSMQSVDISAHAEEEENIIYKRLSWRYPFANMVSKASKVAVTEAKRRFAEMESEESETPLGEGYSKRLSLFRNINLSRPNFMQEKQGLTPAEKGSAMHLVMQHLNLKGDLSEKGVQSQINNFLAQELLTNEQAEAIDIKRIIRFFQTDLGKRMRKAKEIMRELPFTMGLPAGEVYDDIPADSGENVLVQGIIDCLIQEDDYYILIDYKTDKIPSSEVGMDKAIKELTDKYTGQLKVYAMAVEKILKKPVKEKYLYLFSVGKELKI